MKQLISHYLCCHTTKHRSICRLIPWRIHFFYKSLKIAWAVTFIICSLRTSHIQATHPPCLLFEALLTWLMFGIKQHSEAEQDKQLEVSQWRMYTFIILSDLLVNCLTEAFCCVSTSYVANMILWGNSPWLRSFRAIPLFYFRQHKCNSRQGLQFLIQIYIRRPTHTHSGHFTSHSTNPMSLGM